MVNPSAWKALPPDIQALVERNAANYALLQRREIELMTTSLTDKLQRQG